MAIWMTIYFNPPPSYEGRLEPTFPDARQLAISIHSPHTRGDPCRRPDRHRAAISIHSPHTRGDPVLYIYKTIYLNFNPLPSYEGRRKRPEASRGRADFNPLPSHEGRQVPQSSKPLTCSFQSTPLTRGETLRAALRLVLVLVFQSTPLTRGETRRKEHTRWNSRISIHSPHTRGDNSTASGCLPPPHFNPLPSHEGRRITVVYYIQTKDFNPLPSHEGRRRCGSSQARTACISIHSPHTRGD